MTLCADFARDLAEQLPGERHDVARFVAAAAELSVDGLREDLESPRVPRTGRFAER